MLSIIQIIGKYWWVVAIIAFGAASFGYGYKVRGDRCERDMRIAVEMFQAKAMMQAQEFEVARNDIDKNRRKVVYAKNHAYGDCFVDANRLQRINAAITNDTSKLN